MPLLGDLPLLGSLFQSTEKKTSKTELVIFLTPRVVRDEQAAQAITQDVAAAASTPIPPGSPQAGVNSGTGGQK